MRGIAEPPLGRSGRFVRFNVDEVRLRRLQRERMTLVVLDLRERCYSFREIVRRTGIPLATCHRWWHREMAS